MKRAIVTLTGLPLCALLVSCADNNRGIALRAHGFDLAAGSGTALVIDVPGTGTLSATASWGKSGTDIDLYITDSACPGVDELVLGACSVLGRGDSSLDRSETATAVVEAGRYQVFVLALAEQGDAGSVELTLAPLVTALVQP